MRTQSTYISIEYHILSLSKIITHYVHVLSTQKSWKPKHASKDVSEFVKVISLNVQYILFALEGNVIHRRSKLVYTSKVPNPHRFGPPTGISRQHRR
jgi:hypothetical protein